MNYVSSIKSLSIIFFFHLKIREFDWDSHLQGYVLSSFFYGYIATPLAGGWLASRIGGKRVFGLGIAVTALLTCVTPPATRFSVYLLLVIRVIEGLFEVNTVFFHQ